MYIQRNRLRKLCFPISVMKCVRIIIIKYKRSITQVYLQGSSTTVSTWADPATKRAV